jgi:hypothetical protein
MERFEKAKKERITLNLPLKESSLEELSELCISWFEAIF